MAMSEIEAFLNIPYCFENGPSAPDKDDGLNCQALVHLFYKKVFGISLPEEMLSKEIYEDTTLFDFVDPEGELRRGDVFIFGKPEVNHKKLHLAVYIGEKDERGSPLLIHANTVDGKVSIWPRDKFSRNPGYEKTYAVKRYRQLPNQETPV